MKYSWCRFDIFEALSYNWVEVSFVLWSLAYNKDEMKFIIFILYVRIKSLLIKYVV
jgi:Gpi18-like mannosyltransferase